MITAMSLRFLDKWEHGGKVCVSEREVYKEQYLVLILKLRLYSK